MSDSRYSHADLVWCKCGGLFWPGEVKSLQSLPEEIRNGFLRMPKVVVKFFDEEGYEFVEDDKKIYPYECGKKEEFILKGLARTRCKAKEGATGGWYAKFPRDVIHCEKLIGGDENILEKQPFAQNKQKVDYSKIFGDGASDKKKSGKGKDKKEAVSGKKGSKRKMEQELVSSTYNAKISKCIKPAPTPTPSIPSTPSTPKQNCNFGKTSDYQVRILTQPSTSYHIDLQKKGEKQPPTSSYTCQSCPFSTTRLNVFILHGKSHSEPARNKPLLQPRSIGTNGSGSTQTQLKREKVSNLSEKQKLKNDSTKKPQKTKKAFTKKQKRKAEENNKLLGDWSENENDEEEEKKKITESIDTEENVLDNILFSFNDEHHDESDGDTDSPSPVLDKIKDSSHCSKSIKDANNSECLAKSTLSSAAEDTGSTTGTHSASEAVSSLIRSKLHPDKTYCVNVNSTKISQKQVDATSTRTTKHSTLPRVNPKNLKLEQVIEETDKHVTTNDMWKGTQVKPAKKAPIIQMSDRHSIQLPTRPDQNAQLIRHGTGSGLETISAEILAKKHQRKHVKSIKSHSGIIKTKETFDQVKVQIIKKISEKHEIQENIFFKKKENASDCYKPNKLKTFMKPDNKLEDPAAQENNTRVRAQFENKLKIPSIKRVQLKATQPILAGICDREELEARVISTAGPNNKVQDQIPDPAPLIKQIQVLDPLKEGIQVSEERGAGPVEVSKGIQEIGAGPEKLKAKLQNTEATPTRLQKTTAVPAGIQSIIKTPAEHNTAQLCDKMAVSEPLQENEGVLVGLQESVGVSAETKTIDLTGSVEDDDDEISILEPSPPESQNSCLLPDIKLVLVSESSKSDPGHSSIPVASESAISTRLQNTTAVPAGRQSIIKTPAEDNTAQLCDTMAVSEPLQQSWGVSLRLQESARVSAELQDTLTISAELQDTSAVLMKLQDPEAVPVELQDTATVSAELQDTAGVSAELQDTAGVSAELQNTAAVSAELKDTLSVSALIKQTQTADSGKLMDTAADSDELMDTAADSDKLMDIAADSDKLMDTAADSDKTRDTSSESDKQNYTAEDSDKLMNPDVDTDKLMDPDEGSVKPMDTAAYKLMNTAADKLMDTDADSDKQMDTATDSDKPMDTATDSDKLRDTVEAATVLAELQDTVVENVSVQANPPSRDMQQLILEQQLLNRDGETIFLLVDESESHGTLDNQILYIDSSELAAAGIQQDESGGFIEIHTDNTTEREHFIIQNTTTRESVILQQGLGNVVRMAENIEPTLVAAAHKKDIGTVEESVQSAMCSIPLAAVADTTGGVATLPLHPTSTSLAAVPLITTPSPYTYTPIMTPATDSTELPHQDNR